MRSYKKDEFRQYDQNLEHIYLSALSEKLIMHKFNLDLKFLSIKDASIEFSIFDS